MLYFNSDYMEGAHPAVMKRLAETNMEHTLGYGADPYCSAAREKIRRECGCPDAGVYFLAGGTQTNAAVIRAVLRPYQGVLCAETGHINVHEAGAIEAAGHKVLALPHREGKLMAQTMRAYLEAFYRDESYTHMVQPGMVYLSHPTEYGTLYTASELAEISAVCKKYDLFFYVDGARLGYALTAEGTDVTMKTLAGLCDAFYIGGTKVGALFGEAVVIPHGSVDYFITTIKQQGALMAKGRLLGVQFDALFTDGLYYEISRHALQMAEELKKIFRERGYEMWLASPTNQQFVILENEKMRRLREHVSFEFWQELDDRRTVARFVTSWATKMEDLLALRERL